MKGEQLSERWPGYNEQSWLERFVELDRRYKALEDRFYRMATNEIVVRTLRTADLGASGRKG